MDDTVDGRAELVEARALRVDANVDVIAGLGIDDGVIVCGSVMLVGDVDVADVPPDALGTEN